MAVYFNSPSPHPPLHNVGMCHQWEQSSYCLSKQDSTYSADPSLFSQLMLSSYCPVGSLDIQLVVDVSPWKWCQMEMVSYCEPSDLPLDRNSWGIFLNSGIKVHLFQKWLEMADCVVTDDHFCVCKTCGTVLNQKKRFYEHTVGVVKKKEKQISLTGRTDKHYFRFSSKLIICDISVCINYGGHLIISFHLIN